MENILFNDLRIRAYMEMTQKFFGLAGEEDLRGRFSYCRQES